MPYSNVPESMWDAMDSCVEQVLKKNPDWSKERAIATCHKSITKEYAMKQSKRQQRKERQRARAMAEASKGDGLPDEIAMVEESGIEFHELEPEGEKETGEKCDGPTMVMPMMALGGATSWDEYDSYQAAQEAGEELSDINYSFQAMVSNVLRNEMLDDKAKAISALAAGLQARLNDIGKKEAAEKAVTKSEGDGDHPASHYLVVEDPEKPTTWHLRVKGMDGKPDHRLMGAAWAALHEGYRGNKYEGPNKQKAISKLTALYKSEDLDTPGGKSWNSIPLTLKEQFLDWASEKASEFADYLEAQANPVEFIDSVSTIESVKSAEGKPMLLLHTTNAFKDRDGEIFMNAALKEYAQSAEVGSPVDYWHTHWNIGRVTWMDYSEKALFELVEPNDDKAAQELVAAIAANPDYWGCSHRFYYSPKERKAGVFSKLNKVKSTVLPLAAASNPYTATAVVKGKEVLMEQKKLDELKSKLSPEAYALAEGFIKGEEQKSRQLVEAGIETKEAKPDEAQEAPAAPAPAPIPQENQENKQLTEALAQVKALTAKVEKLEADAKAAREAEAKKELAPRGAEMFSAVRASQAAQTVLPDNFKEVGPGQKALEAEDPMIASLKTVLGVR